MNDDRFEDLKQFIDGRISQSEVNLRTDISKAKGELSKQMTEGFSGVGDAIESVNDEHETLEKRVTKLEAQTVS